MMRYILLLFCVLVSSPALCVVGSLTVDGIPLETNPKPEIRNGRLFVPASVFRKIGLAVDDLTPGKAMVAWPDSDVIWDFEAGQAWVPGPAVGDRISIPAAPYVKDGVLMVPLRAVFDGKTERLEWDNRTRTAHLYRDQNWLKWRMQDNADFIRSHPDWYETPVTAPDPKGD